MSHPDDAARRRVLSALLSGAAVAAVLPAHAHEGAAHADTMLGMGDSDGYLMSAKLTQHCATCEFWGGERRLSEDRGSLTVMGLGWCNNPKSPNYRKRTSPEHGPMDVWQKWGALG